MENEAQVVRERVSLARAATLVVDLFVSDNVHALQVLGRPDSAELDDRDVARAGKALADAVALNPNWVQVGLLDSKGRNVLPSTGVPARSVSVADRDYFQDAMRTGRPAVSGAIIGRFSGNPTVVIAVPATLGSGDRGLLTGILSLAFLEEQLLALPTEPGIEMIAVDRAGRAIVHPDPAVVASLRDLSRLPSVPLALAGETGSFRRTVEGRDLVVAYAPARVPGWGVVVRQPADAAFALIRSGVLQATAIAVVSALIALVLAWMFGGLLERYYNRVVEAERRIGRDREELLNILGHELKTPLTSLSLAAQSLGRAVERQGGDDQVRRYVGLIRDQITRANRLVTELLESSRLAQPAPLRRDHVDLAVLVRAAVERQVGFLIDSPQQRIRLLADSAGVYVDGDAFRLDHVVTNLLTNAVKYSPDGGPVEVSIARADHRAVLEVTDHGMGIAEDERESVFSPFARSRAARERGIEGTGLGLYLSKRIVEAHDGTISVTDTDGGGTTIVVSLPASAGGP